MVVRSGATTRANNSTSTWAARAISCALAGIDGGAGGEHVIDQYQPLSYDFGLLVYWYPEGVLYIVGPLGFGLAYLLRRGARPFDSAVQHRHAPSSGPSSAPGRAGGHI